MPDTGATIFVSGSPMIKKYLKRLIIMNKEAILMEVLSVRGPNAVNATRLRLAIDEDWYLYSERNHTTEQVSYIVFE